MQRQGHSTPLFWGIPRWWGFAAALLSSTSRNSRHFYTLFCDFVYTSHVNLLPRNPRWSRTTYSNCTGGNYISPLHSKIQNNLRSVASAENSRWTMKLWPFRQRNYGLLLTKRIYLVTLRWSVVGPSCQFIWQRFGPPNQEIFKDR